MNSSVLILIGAGGTLFLLWLIVGLRHFKYLKSGINEQWELLDERLRKRHDLVPNLIETVRGYAGGRQEDLMRDFMVDRRQAARHHGPGSKKIEYEHALSLSINKVFDLGADITGLGSDTNFLELRTEIDDLEQDIEMKVKKYNEMVRSFNKQRKIFLLWPLAAVFRYERMDIFEVEV